MCILYIYIYIRVLKPRSREIPPRVRVVHTRVFIYVYIFNIKSAYPTGCGLLNAPPIPGEPYLTLNHPGLGRAGDDPAATAARRCRRGETKYSNAPAPARRAICDINRLLISHYFVIIRTYRVIIRVKCSAGDVWCLYMI